MGLLNMAEKNGQKRKTVSIENAAREVDVAITRLALLHLSFSKTLVDEFGKEKGKELIIKSVLEYGKRVGDRIKKGLPDLPRYGVYAYHDTERYYGCVLAKIFKEYGEEELGCLYCYVDAAKSMQVDPNSKFIHITCAACGDENCTFEKTATNAKERKSFQTMNKEWKLVDKRLAEGIKHQKTTRNRNKA
jgi:hypothetical protein